MKHPHFLFKKSQYLTTIVVALLLHIFSIIILPNFLTTDTVLGLEQLLKPKYVSSFHVTLPYNIHSQWQSSKNYTVYIEIVKETCLFGKYLLWQEAQTNWNCTWVFFKSEVTAKPYLEVKHLKQDSSAGVAQAYRFPRARIEERVTSNPIPIYLDRPFLHCSSHEGCSRSINIRRQNLECEVTANSTCNLNYFTYGYYHYNSEFQWSWTSVLFTKVGKGIFVLSGKR